MFPFLYEKADIAQLKNWWGGLLEARSAHSSLADAFWLNSRGPVVP